jgi:hypothetical protein
MIHNKMKSSAILLSLVLVQATNAWVTMPTTQRFSPALRLADEAASELGSTPSSFREAEVLGLRLMQEGKYEDALNGAFYFICIFSGFVSFPPLQIFISCMQHSFTAFKNGMKLPGSRPDVVRTKLLSGPSPVGGAFGGLESNRIMSLDEFELQAAHYNMACAHAQLGNAEEVRFAMFTCIYVQSLYWCLPLA